MELPPPLVIGRALLADDPLYARVPADDRDACVGLALDAGARMADSVRAGCGDDPDAIAARCGVPVVETDASADFGQTIVFATYATRPAPGRIFLYRTAIARADALLADPAIAAALGIRVARPIYLAHELFHHFDGAQGAVPVARRRPVTLVAVGPLRWTGGLASLAEIAAGAFAQALLGLRTHPHALDRLLPGDPESHPRAA